MDVSEHWSIEVCLDCGRDWATVEQQGHDGHNPPGRWREVEVVPATPRGAVDLDALVAEVAKRLAASSSLDEATAWNLLYPPNGALAPLVPHLRGDLNA